MTAKRELNDPLYPLNIIKIRWCDLFRLFSDDELNLICEEKQMDGNQKPFLKAILPDDMFRQMFASSRTHDGLVSKATFSRFFEVRSSQIKTSYKKAYEYLTADNPSTGKPYTLQDAGFIRTVYANWEKILEKLSVNDPEFRTRITADLQKMIADNIDDRQDYFELTSNLTRLLKQDIIEALTRLTFIASTVPYWDEQSCDELHDVIMEPLMIEGKTNYTEPVSKNREEAQKMLEAARQEFQFPDSDKDAYRESIRECCRKCQRIVNLRPKADRIILGEAYYMLYICAKEKSYRLPAGESKEQYLIQSNRCGYPKGEKEYLHIHPTSLTAPLHHSLKAGHGVCILNCSNRYTDVLERTMPDSKDAVWTKISFDRNHPEAMIFDDLRQEKFFFLSDDFTQNLTDTLCILQYLKEKSRRFSEPPRIEIFLRGKKETASPIIDTAISHISDLLIPVSIIDDDQAAAQRLLSFHPVYFPLHRLPAQTKATLNLVVIGDSGCADWIIREGFWMMSFRNPDIETRITIIAEHANEVEERLSCLCPSLMNADNCLEESGLLNQMQFAEIRKESVRLDTYALKSAVTKQILKKGEYPYFAVCTDSDSFNLSCAIRIREWMIREYVNQGKIKYIDNLPVIAFRHSDPDISYLSRDMVVQNEAYGNRWYNSYSLIPFGSITERYEWDTIGGGIIEEITKCIHFAYNDIPADPAKQDPEAVKNALISYYSRTYNRDSSRAVALYLPYRLFLSSSDRHHAVPSHWSIEDERAFFSEEELPLLADRYEQTTERIGEDFESLAEAEHARWTRWLCAHGWVPATKEQAADYINNGENPRQQLYIARMHPCICSWNRLDALSSYLKENCKDFNKNFKDLDRKIVKLTAEFLRRSFFDFLS